jgi:hypothetical protein
MDVFCLFWSNLITFLSCCLFYFLFFSFVLAARTRGTRKDGDLITKWQWVGGVRLKGGGGDGGLGHGFWGVPQ